MKRYLLTIMFALTIVFGYRHVNADTKTIDMTTWTFKSITPRSDQDKNIVVSKYMLKEDLNKYGFCIEPTQDFLPLGSIYFIETNTNKKIYEIVKAYDAIGLENSNYYIAAQLMIWDLAGAPKYTFDSKDYSEYINYIKRQIELQNEVIEINVEFKANEVCEIKGNFTNYSIDSDKIEILSKDSNSLKFKTESLYKDSFKLDLIPDDLDKNKQLIYRSDTSQDVYYFDGEYSNLREVIINVNVLPLDDDFSIYYSKKDIDGNLITGAEFSLFQIDEKSDEELIFIEKNKEINLYSLLLEDYDLYSNLNIDVSERYSKYIDNLGNIITDQLGYFDFSISNNDEILKKGRIYVVESNLCPESSNIINSKLIYKGYSEELDINSINNLSHYYDYYLCESRPVNGYTYTSNPCVLVETNKYKNETIEFVNKVRTYSLKLVKHNNENIHLDGAVFKVTYINNDSSEETTFATGSFKVERMDNSKYLFYKHESDDKINIHEFNDSEQEFVLDNAKEGKYYFYQSNNNTINEDMLKNESIVVKGGFILNDLPYNSSLRIEEIKAPEGYMITEPVYYVDPSLDYSDITFENYRINYIDILPKKHYTIPKTCVDE